MLMATCFHPRVAAGAVVIWMRKVQRRTGRFQRRHTAPSDSVLMTRNKVGRTRFAHRLFRLRDAHARRQQCHRITAGRVGDGGGGTGCVDDAWRPLFYPA